MGDLKDIKRSTSIIDKIKTLNVFNKKDTAEEEHVINPITETKEEVKYTNEDVWDSIKSNYINMSKLLDSATTYEETGLLSQKADVFNKLAQNMIKGIKDNYDEKNRDSEYLLKQEELKIKRIHEVNETLKIAKGSKEHGSAIIENVIRYLAPTEPSTELKQIGIQKENEER